MALRDLVLRFRLDDQVTRKLGVFGRNLNSGLRGLSRLRSPLASLTSGIRGLLLATGALGAGAGIRRVITRLDDIGDTAARLKISTDALQEFGFAARFSDMEFSELVNGLRFFGKNQKKFGLTGDLRTEVLRAANAFSKLKTSADKKAFATTLFGRGGDAFIPFLEGGAKRLLEFADEAHRRGLIRSREQLDLASQADDNLKHLRDTLGGVGDRLAVTVLPTVVSLTGQLDKWLQSNQGLQTMADISTTIASAANAMAVSVPKIAAAIGFLGKIPAFARFVFDTNHRARVDSVSRSQFGDRGFSPMAPPTGVPNLFGGIPKPQLDWNAAPSTGGMTLTVRLVDPRGLLVGQGKGALRPGSAMDVSADLGAVMATP